VTLPDRVTPEEAAVVFRRAAEFEATGTHGDALLDTGTVEAIGREAGLSPAAIQAALGELRSESELPPAGKVLDVVSSRVVPGTVSDVTLAVDEFARRNFLTDRAHDGTTIIWRRKKGFGRAVVRRVGGRARFPLSALKELRASVADHPVCTGFVRVRLEGRLDYPWQVVPVRTQALVAAGLVGAGVLVNGAWDDPGIPVAYGAWATAAGVTASGIGVRSYSKAMARTDAALHGFLSWLEHSHPVPLGPQPSPPTPRA
jgi:hypothetical protein